MPYGTEWRPSKAAECQAEAERRAGKAPNGYYYRFEQCSYAAPADEYGEPIPGAGRTTLELHAYPIHNKTRTGATLDIRIGERRMHVNLERNKKFANPTVKDALVSFRARKTREIRIYESRIAIAKRMLDLAALEPESPFVHLLENV